MQQIGTDFAQESSSADPITDLRIALEVHDTVYGKAGAAIIRVQRSAQGVYDVTIFRFVGTVGETHETLAGVAECLQAAALMPQMWESAGASLPLSGMAPLRPVIRPLQRAPGAYRRLALPDPDREVPDLSDRARLRASELMQELLATALAHDDREL